MPAIVKLKNIVNEMDLPNEEWRAFLKRYADPSPANHWV